MSDCDMCIRRSLGEITVFILLIFPFFSCAGDGGPRPKEAPKAAVVKEHHFGPVDVRLALDKDELTVADTAELIVRVEAQEGYTVDLPDLEGKVGEFQVLDKRIGSPQLLENNRLRTWKSFTLEPFLPGVFTIPPLKTVYRKKAAAEKDRDNGEAHSIEMGPLTVRVRSVLGGAEDNATLRPLMGPVGAPASLVPWAAVPGIGGAVTAVVAFAVWSLRRYGRKGPEVKPTHIPSHETACKQLRELLEEDLVSRGEVRRFYARLSDIVRLYIENRFGLHAPRHTTEEFLATIQRDSPFNAHEQSLLDEFLRHCDLVKFAEHRPSRKEIDKTVESCKSFIEATRQKNGGTLESDMNVS